MKPENVRKIAYYLVGKSKVHRQCVLKFVPSDDRISILKEMSRIMGDIKND